MIDSAITALVQYAVRAGLLEACDETWAVNTLLGILELSAKQDTVIAYWELPDDRTCGTITVNADTPICAEAWTVR